VSERDAYDAPRTSISEADAPEIGPEPHHAHDIAALIAPLVESHEQHLQLARENGALSERIIGLEHEIQTLRGEALRHTVRAGNRSLDSIMMEDHRSREQPQLMTILLVVLFGLLGLALGWTIQPPF
jgi:hypothetical protein